MKATGQILTVRDLGQFSPNQTRTAYYEPNPKRGTAQLIGSGAPGLLYEICQQVPAVFMCLDASREALRFVEWSTVRCGSTEQSPEGDETPEESAFNDAVEGLVRHRFGVVQSDETLAMGAGQLFALGVDFFSMGTLVAWPHLHGGETLEEQSLTFTVIPLYTVTQTFMENYVTGPVTTLGVQTSTKWTVTEINTFFRMTNGTTPNVFFGMPELRPLVQDCLNLREALAQQGNALVRSANGGAIVVKYDASLNGSGASENDDAAQASAVQMAEDLATGKVKGAAIPGTWDVEAVPVGQGTLQAVTATVDSISTRIESFLGSSVSGVLGRHAYGSRAAAETAAEIDTEKQIRTSCTIIDRMWSALAQWLARRAEYTGRIRKAIDNRAAGNESLASVQDIATAKQAGMLGPWSNEDIAVMRARQGLPEMDASLLEGADEQMEDEAERPEPDDGSEESDGMEDAAEVSPDNSAFSDHGCGCGQPHAHTFGDMTLGWMDSRGKWKRHYRGPLVVDVNGVQVAPESGFAFSELEDERAAIIAELIASIDTTRAEQVAAIFDTWRELVADGIVTNTELGALIKTADDWAEDYGRAIDKALQDVSRISDRLQAEAQDALTVPGQGIPADEVGAELRRTVANLPALARMNATTIAERVAKIAAGEMMRYRYDTAAELSEEVSKVLTGPALARPSIGLANRVEAMSGLRVADKRGARVVAAVRADSKDQEVCAWCLSQNGLVYRFPEDKAEFDAYVDAHGPPDPDCYGTRGGNPEACRCGWTLLYGAANG